ncbi:hypothetical protein FKP32DRAFT_1640477 [Trametes sanguinea]|nr:hypothetical protein FKP32DRAFT_1640477 [Trametes sanguinea]
MSAANSTLAPSAISTLYRNPRIGDLTLRTSDGVELHVYRAIVAASIPVFEDMFSIPQPPSASSEKPTIDVAESSEVWETLIMLCYAPRPPTVDDFADLDAIRAILDAGVKYAMAVATEYASTALMFPALVAKQPYSVYAVGCAYRLTEVSRVAARQTLTATIYFEYSKELDLIPLRAYHRLSEYRRRCGDAIRAQIQANQIIATPFLPYVESIYSQAVYLPDPNLARSKVLTAKVIQSVSVCPYCPEIIHGVCSKASEALYKWLEEAVTQVRPR